LNAELTVISVFPNPASDFVIIALEEKPGEKVLVEIFWIDGQKLKTVEMEEAMSGTSIKKLPAGSYQMIVTIR